MPESRGQKVPISIFFDSNIEGNKSTRRSHTGKLIFINKTPINWYNKSHSTVEVSTCGADVCAIEAGVKMVEALRYKL